MFSLSSRGIAKRPTTINSPPHALPYNNPLAGVVVGKHRRLWLLYPVVKFWRISWKDKAKTLLLISYEMSVLISKTKIRKNRITYYNKDKKILNIYEQPIYYRGCVCLNNFDYKFTQSGKNLVWGGVCLRKLGCKRVQTVKAACKAQM